MSLPEGEDVRQWDVMEWVFQQARYLASPLHHHLLLYLCSHAFYKVDNPESARVGQVLSQRDDYASMQFATGLSKNSVRRALEGLRLSGYVYVEMYPSDRRDNRIVVLWSEEWDEMRAHARAGVKPLPAVFGPRVTEEPMTSKGDVISLADWRDGKK